MRIRKKKETFEGISDRVFDTQARIHELQHKIEQEKIKLAEELALLEQFKVNVEVTTRTVKEQFGVKPQFGWQA